MTIKVFLFVCYINRKTRLSLYFCLDEGLKRRVMSLLRVLLTINSNPPPSPVSHLCQKPSWRKYQTKSSLRPFLHTKKSKQQSVTRSVVKIKSINNFAVRSKFHLNNRVFIFSWFLIVPLIYPNSKFISLKH